MLSYIENNLLRFAPDRQTTGLTDEQNLVSSPFADRLAKQLELEREAEEFNQERAGQQDDHRIWEEERVGYEEFLRSIG